MKAALQDAREVGHHASSTESSVLPSEFKLWTNPLEMGKPDQAPEDAAGRGRGGRLSARRKRETVLRLQRIQLGIAGARASGPLARRRCGRPRPL